ncbi:hypothetical protein GDO78_020747 [Eleutherodactylus coqui]|uniref:Taste receptor type 2 n=1 Tax=Eleutherodactylus coqui TaxID=57060 RepID=A0A8J6BJI2_ELECQ|nr:hypothetical protein GDO78_020747 [Eleutherodactylus coqui]
MADSTEGNTDIQYLGLLVLALIALIAGLVIHSFIIGVNVTDWWTGRSVTPVDQIVTSLGVSRMCTQCGNTLYAFLYTFRLKSLNSLIPLLVIAFANIFFSYANFWLTSLLSVVFCLKISNSHTRLFLYLKGMIAHRTVYFIGASVLLSAFTCLMSFSVVTTDVMKGVTYNTTIHNLSMNCGDMHYIYTYTIGAFFPLLFYCISTIFLFSSLYQHTTKMKMSSNLSINLETYYSVMKLLSFTFIYNTSYFLTAFASLLYYYFYCADLLWLRIVFDFLPVLHSSYLIYRTAKLRSQMSKVLQDVTDFLFPRKATETRENIEVVAL